MANIIIIDDDEHFSDILVGMLVQDHHEVMTARDGFEGLRLIHENKPDLIVTDILMPSMDGFELMKALRHGGSSIPIIAISGGWLSISAEFTLSTAILLGARATLRKPFTKVLLRQAIDSVLS